MLRLAVAVTQEEVLGLDGLEVLEDSGRGRPRRRAPFLDRRSVGDLGRAFHPIRVVGLALRHKSDPPPPAIAGAVQGGWAQGHTP
jgi:hypothetical protein